MNDQALQTAERLFHAIETGDVDAIRNIYTPETQIWHNHDNIAQSVDENLAVLRWLLANVKEVKYTEVRRQPIPSGFVQQHVLRERYKDAEFARPACIICKVEGGKITRLDEYLDSAQTAIFSDR